MTLPTSGKAKVAQKRQEEDPKRGEPQVPEMGWGSPGGGTESICMGSEYKEQLRGAGAPRAQSYKAALAAQLIELGRPSLATRATPASALPPVPAAAGARRVPRDRLKEGGTAA